MLCSMARISFHPPRNGQKTHGRGGPSFHLRKRHRADGSKIEKEKADSKEGRVLRAK